jgi:hypothetical protein
MRPLRVIFIFVVSRARSAPGGQFRSNRRPPQDASPEAAGPLSVPDETILGNPRNHPETERGYLCSQLSGGKDRLEADMNHSIHSLDRSTHLKIVVVALVAGIVVAGLGISARSSADYSQTAHVIKAGKLVTVTSSDAMVVR